MNIFLDSSFFFPFISIGLNDVSQSDILDLIQDEMFVINRSELTIFEISAKGWKYIYEGLINQEDLINGINSIMYIERIKPIPFYDSPIQILAGYFKKEHNDFMDCLILASAIINSELFITLDRTLITKIDEIWKSEIEKTNPNFQALLWDDFKKNYLKKSS
jgi:predicted nucleic-acid-binding protein